MKNLLKDEKGTSLVLTALLMVVLIAFTSLAVDGGNLYFHHTRLQDIADACALAACNEVVEAKGSNSNRMNKAMDAAISYAGRNNLPAVKQTGYTAGVTYSGDEAGTMTLSFPDGVKEVKVDLVVTSNLYFARVLGMDYTPVKVSATARAGQVSEEKENLVPISFFWEDYVLGERYDLTLAPGGGESGNYGYLDYDEPNMFDEYLKSGYNGTVKVGDKILTYTGASVGQVAHALNGVRIAGCTHVPSCYYDEVTEEVHCQEGCPRMVIIPIISDFFEDINGKKYVTVKGFAQFFLINYDQSSKILSGVFVAEIDEGAVIGDSPEYMVQAVRLVN